MPAPWRRPSRYPSRPRIHAGRPRGPRHSAVLQRSRGGRDRVRLGISGVAVALVRCTRGSRRGGAAGRPARRADRECTRSSSTPASRFLPRFEGVSGGSGAAYLPIGWERLSLPASLPERVVCHARLRDSVVPREGGPPDILTADLRLFDASGAGIGTVSGFAPEARDTGVAAGSGGGRGRFAVRGPVAGAAPHSGALSSADFLASSGRCGRARAGRGGISGGGRPGPRLAGRPCRPIWSGWRDPTRWRLWSGWGWRRDTGAAAKPGELRRRLKGWGSGPRAPPLRVWSGCSPRWGEPGAEPGPAGLVEDPETLVAGTLERHPGGRSEIGLLARCGAALEDVLRGRADPPRCPVRRGAPETQQTCTTRRRPLRGRQPHCGSRRFRLPSRPCRQRGGCGSWKSGRAPAARRRPCSRRCRKDGSITCTRTSRRGFFAAAEERFRKKRPIARVPGAGHRSGPGETGLRVARVRLGSRSERAACNARLGRRPEALPAVAGRRAACCSRWRDCKGSAGWT